MSTYRTVERMLMICLKEEQHRIELHLKEGEQVVFIGWLTVRRELKAKTIDGYLSGLRQLYIEKCMEPLMISTNLIACLLEGQEHMDNIKV